jgi:hypothetical protein
VCYASLFHAKSFCERIRTAIAHSRRCPLSRHDLAIPGLHPDPSSKAATLQRTNEDMRTRISTLKNALHSERTRNTETHREKVSRGDAPPPPPRPPVHHHHTRFSARPSYMLSSTHTILFVCLSGTAFPSTLTPRPSAYEQPCLPNNALVLFTSNRNLSHTHCRALQ